MSKLMICPKAKECQLEYCPEQDPHRYCMPIRNRIEADCPACIEYKPEPQGKVIEVYHGNGMWSQYRNVQKIHNTQSHKLVSLPDKETIVMPEQYLTSHPLKAELEFIEIVDAVYSSAKELDIDELAEYIDPSIRLQLSNTIREFIKDKEGK